MALSRSGYTGRPRGCGGIGRRARFRSVCPSGRGGSSPLIRIVVSVDPPAAPKRPELPDELEETSLGDAPLTGLRLERVSLRGLAFEERTAADLRLEESVLVNVMLDGCEAAGLTLSDVRVTGGSWANLRAVRGSLTRLEAHELRATGVDFAETELRDVAFEGC